MPRKQTNTKNPRGVFEKVPGSGVWWVLYYDQHGKRHREKVGPKSLAIEVYRKRKSEIKEEEFFPEKVAAKRRRLLLADAIRSYLEESRATKRTWKDDERYGAVWVAELGNQPMDAVNASDIEAWRRKKGQDCKPATVNRHVAFLKRVFNVAIRDGRCKENPVGRVKMLRENNARLRFMSELEESLLREVFQEDKWHFVELALHTGLRASEQFGLRWEHVDFRSDVLTIPRSKHGERRHVQMNARVREILRAMPSRLQSEWVYPSKDETRHRNFMSFRHRYWEPALKKAGLKDLRWHDLRHTFASRLVMRGVDLSTVRELMGHKTIQMTQRYAHLAPSHLRAAVDVLCQEPTATATATRTKTTPLGDRLQGA